VYLQKFNKIPHIEIDTCFLPDPPKNIIYKDFIKVNDKTVKPVYLEHVDNWFLKLVLCNLNKYIFKNHLSTC
jgi:hypothetical protein